MEEAPFHLVVWGEKKKEIKPERNEARSDEEMKNGLEITKMERKMKWAMSRVDRWGDDDWSIFVTFFHVFWGIFRGERGSIRTETELGWIRR